MMGNWLRRVMIGRYGVDQLTWVLLGLAVILSVCGNIFGIGLLRILCWAALVYGYYRMFSRNIYARQRENQAVLNAWNRLKNHFAQRRQHAADRKLYRYFTCPTCKQKLRVPKGKGKINITCPKCNTSFIRKS